MRKHIIFFAVACLGLISCEKVINLDLGGTTPRLVIEGNIYNKPGPYYVTLSETVNFNQPNSYPPVSGATVIISDNHGVKDTLTEKDPGTYVTSKIIGVPGNTYSLSVIAGETTYNASSTMPVSVNIDSIFFEKFVIGNFDMVTIKYQDPVYIKNYYRIVEYYNGIRKADFNTLSDDVYDGMSIRYSLMADEKNQYLFNSGDSIRIRLESIDKGVYDYFRTAESNGVDSQSATPANPLSNISNNALGYFNACSFTTKSIVYK